MIILKEIRYFLLAIIFVFILLIFFELVFNIYMIPFLNIFSLIAGVASFKLLANKMKFNNDEDKKKKVFSIIFLITFIILLPFSKKIGEKIGAKIILKALPDSMAYSDSAFIQKVYSILIIFGEYLGVILTIIFPAILVLIVNRILHIQEFKNGKK